MAHDVFISYSSKDKPTADAVCAGLEAAGIRCWIAPRDILPGQHWGGAIVEAIHASRLMVVVLSTNSNASEQVLREVERSVHRAIPIIPFRIEEFELAASFEYFLSVPHWLDAMTGPLEEHIERLVHTSRVLLEQHPAAPRSGAAPPGAAPSAATAPTAPPATTAPTVDLPPARPLPDRTDDELSADDRELLAAVRPLPPTPAEATRPAAAPPKAAAPAALQSAAPVAAAPPPAMPAPAREGRTAVPPWVWAIPAALVLVALAVFAATRALAPASEPGRTPEPTLAAASVPTVAPPAAQPPAVASARVQVTSSVEGATLLVNGQPAGRTPQTLSLQPGQYRLTLQAATYRDWSQTIDVGADQQVPVQAILEPLPPLEVLEVTERVLGRDAAVDSGRIVRIRTPTDSFQVSDVVNAVVYFRPKTYQIRDLSYRVTHRWQVAGEAEPGVVAGTSRGPRDEPLLFTHACALAVQLDPSGSNTPLTLEIQVDGETVGRFTFRISGGTLANAPADPVAACDRSRLPTIVVLGPDAMQDEGLL